MSDSYALVLADMRSMTGTFEREHTAYLAIKPKLTPPVAATGDGHLDATLQTVMDTLSLMHDEMATSIDDHAKGLRTAGDSYERHDVDAHGLFDDLMPEGS